MAPAGEEVYFPSVEKCLKDQKLLLTWRDVYTSLLNSTSNSTSTLAPGIQTFLSSPSSLSLLKRPLKPHEAPSSGTRSQFDHRTAAINIPPSDASAPYNIAQIKEDALWLSQQLDVDEVAALRIAVLEWQRRPALALLSRSLDDERTLSGDEGRVDGEGFGSSIFGSRTAAGEAARSGTADREEEARRTRRAMGVRLWYEERAYLLATARLVLCARDWNGQEQDLEVGRDVLGSLRAELETALLPQADGAGFVLQAVNALGTALKAADNFNALFESLGEPPFLRVSFTDALLLHLTSILELIILVSSYSTTLLSADAVKAFFDLMLSTGYLSGVLASTSAPQHSPTLSTALQLNLSLAGLAVLKLPTALDFATADYDDHRVLSAPETRKVWIVSRDCVKSVQDSMLLLAEHAVTPAAVAMLAWVTVVSVLQSFAQASGAIDDADAEDYDRSPSPNPNRVVEQGHWRTDALNAAYLELAASGSGSGSAMEAVTPVAQVATQSLGVFSQISALVGALDQFYAPSPSSSILSQGLGCRFREVCTGELYDLFTASQSLVNSYDADVISALLSLLGGDRSYAHLHGRSVDSCEPLAELAATEIANEHFSPSQLFHEMRYRYPHETGAFHQYVRALLLNCELSEEKVRGMLEYLSHAETYMLRLPQNFTGYRQDAAADGFAGDEVVYRLEKDIPFFYDAKTGLGYEHEPPNPFAITYSSSEGEDEPEHDRAETTLLAGSLGTLVAPGRPPTIVFGKAYAPLRYMLGCLCTSIPGNTFVNASTGLPSSVDEVADILALFSVVLLASHKAGITGLNLLDETYALIEPSRNLLEIVAEVFEAHLSSVSASGAGPGEGSLTVLVECLNFFHAVALTAPTRLWPILARSRFLEIEGRGGSLASIVAAVEMVSGRYEFLKAAVRLYEALVEASLWTGSSSSLNGGALTRFSERRTLNGRGGGESLPQRLASTVMTSFTRTLLEVFAQSRAWRYASALDRASISASLADVFDKLLHYVYGLDDALDPRGKPVTGVLAGSAEMVRDAGNVGAVVVDMLFGGIEGVERAGFGAHSTSTRREVESAVGLACSAVDLRVSRGDGVSDLERRLFGAAPVLVRLYAADEGFKALIAGLLERLITAPLPSGQLQQRDQPNLLGNLSPASARDFLVLLGNLDEPFRERGTQKAVWKMLGAMVGGGREQWFALSLITGKVPHDRASRTKTQANEATRLTPSRTVSVFSHALDALSDVALVDGRPFWTRLPSELALEMLRFVASCQDNWSWAVDSEVRAHPRFIEAITKGYIRHLHREPSDSVASLTRETAVAATVAEVLAMYLHSSLQVGDAEAAVERVVPHLQYLEKYGVASPKYSTSLHSNLKTNLEKWHKGLRLESFKHTTVFPTSAGGDYYYDVEFASKVLNQRRSEGAKKLKGLEGMLRDANEELSFCDAQIGLIKSWKLLAMQLVVGVKADTPLSGLLIDVVRSCLEENARMATPTLAIFEGLRMQRVELATGVLQRVVVLEFKDAQQSEALQGLFRTAWDTIRTAGFEFESVFSSAGEEVAYYRGLLQILFLTLKPLTQASATRNPRKEGQPPAQATELIEVLVNIVLKGFKSLTSALHEDAHAASSSPSDFVLLTATLQLLLRIPGIDLLFSQLALHVANQRTLQHATSLFSWADQPQFLLPPSDDPVYGELAILFLLELSSVPAVAEAMAVDGVLAQLASAKIMRLYTRPRGMGPFDHPARVHSIWARGVLPLCLNLLDAVGAPITAEVVTFLNAFPNQLARLAAELANRGSAVGTRPGDSHISLSLAGEVHSLSLISLLIERYRAAGASTGVLVNEIPSLELDRAAVKEDVEDFVLGRSVLSALVVPASEREAELMRLRPVGAGSTAGNRLEERIMVEFGQASACLAGEV